MSKEISILGFYDEENYVPEKLPDAKNKMFEDKIREYLVVTNDYSGAAVGKTAQMDILASVDVQTDEFDSMEGKIIWETTDEELKTGAFFKRFKKGTIYRILARRSKAKPENKYNNMYSLVRVIEDSISDERLESILKEYRKKVVIEDEISGKFVLDKEFLKSLQSFQLIVSFKSYLLISDNFFYFLDKWHNIRIIL